jgi:hypothetical protein
MDDGRRIVSPHPDLHMRKRTNETSCHCRIARPPRHEHEEGIMNRTANNAGFNGRCLTTSIACQQTRPGNAKGNAGRQSRLTYVRTNMAFAGKQPVFGHHQHHRRQIDVHAHESLRSASMLCATHTNALFNAADQHSGMGLDSRNFLAG